MGEFSLSIVCLPPPSHFSPLALFSLLFLSLPFSLSHPPLSPLLFCLSLLSSKAELSLFTSLSEWHSCVILMLWCGFWSPQLSMLAWGNGVNESPVTDEKLQWPTPERTPPPPLKKRKRRQKRKRRKPQRCGPGLLFCFHIHFRHATAEACWEAEAWLPWGYNHMRWGLIAGHTSASVPAFITVLNCSPGQ